MPTLSALFLSVAILAGAQTQSTASQPTPLPADLPAFTVLGYSIRTTNAAEMSPTGGKIGPLWASFMQGGADAIPGVADPEKIYAVYTHYESNETGAYDMVLGKSVKPETTALADMKIMRIAAGHYLVFTAASASPDAVKAAWMSVHAYFAQHPAPRRAFTTDLEQHSHTGIKIFIAIQ